MAGGALPIVHGFLLCREVFKDVRTGEHILLGPTNHLQVQPFPCQFPVMGFLQWIEAHGSYRLSADLRDTNEEVVWHWSAEQSVHHPQPLLAHQVVMQWMMYVPQPGRYRLELRANEAELVSQSLLIGPTEFFRAGG